MWFILAGILGVVCGMVLPYNVSVENLPYVAMAILAALDSVFGALLAYFNKRFNMSVFVLGLFSNAFLSVFLTYIGNLLGISLYFAVIVVFGVRIFNNMAAIRRLTLDVYFEKRTREKDRIKRLALMAADDDNVDVTSETETETVTEKDGVDEKNNSQPKPKNKKKDKVKKAKIITTSELKKS